MGRLATERWGPDRRAAGFPRAMPEVVDTCSLASPASVCRTKHLHLRCSVDFTRRVLTGTAALTVQSQEDDLRSLVQWDVRPMPPLPRLPASRPSPCCGLCPASCSALPLASLGVHPQLTAHILHLLFSYHSFLSVRFYSRLPHPISSLPHPYPALKRLLSCGSSPVLEHSFARDPRAGSSPRTQVTF